MASLTEDIEIATSSQVLEQLSQTQFACSSLTQLSSRSENFVYRGVLTHPVSRASRNEAPIETVIVKYSTDPVHVVVDHPIFQTTLLDSLTQLPSFIASPYPTVIKSPRLYHYNIEQNTQILEDFSGTAAFKPMFFSPNANDLLPPSSRETIGRHIGSWLRSFHTWAIAPEQASLRAHISPTDPVRLLKRSLTYDCFLDVLSGFPKLLDGHLETLKTIQDELVKEFVKPVTEKEDNWRLIHGDLWSGNILLPATGWHDRSDLATPNKIFIIDWEFAQYGYRCYDLGQLIGDLYERKLFNDVNVLVPVLQGVIDGYGVQGDEMAFVLQSTLVYIWSLGTVDGLGKVHL